MNLREQHAEGVAPGRGISVVVGLWLAVWGLWLVVTAGHYTSGQFVGPGLILAGGGLVVRVWHVTRSRS